MTDAEIIEVYLNHIARWYGIKPTSQLADELDLSEAQIEELVDHVSFPAFSKFKIAQSVTKATYADRYKVEPRSATILPFRRET